MTETRRRGGYLVPLMLVIGVAVVVTNVFPFRQIIAQNRQVEQARTELATLQDENAALEREVEALRSPSEIERIARQDFGYVRPGDTSYVIVEPVRRPGTVVESAPQPQVESGGVFDAIWDWLTGRDLVADG